MCKYWAWGSVVVKALRHQSNGPEIDFRWCHWGFFFSVVPPTEPCALRSTQPQGHGFNHRQVSDITP